MPFTLGHSIEIMTDDGSGLPPPFCDPPQGTGLYSIQCTFNHSCDPSATAEGESSGAASLLALKDIAVGDEITISYIEEEASYRERQAQLKDYGFKCECERCQREKSTKRGRKPSGGAVDQGKKKR